MSSSDAVILEVHQYVQGLCGPPKTFLTRLLDFLMKGMYLFGIICILHLIFIFGGNIQLPNIDLGTGYVIITEINNWFISFLAFSNIFLFIFITYLVVHFFKYMISE
ncbi:hypothetical protein MK079_03705 [Candidatus Gracilibacteria bacterium]|nr:hypothetical protein [Candidatus Gracilibacteria bacterium]